jgi:hypothetical protein
MLLHPSAWDALSPEEKNEVLALFPDGDHVLDSGKDNARPDIVALKSNNNFRHDCKRYTERLESGFHDPEWLGQAWAAHERRRAGDFDEYLAQKFEDDWGVEIPENLRPMRADAARGSSPAVADPSQGGDLADTAMADSEPTKLQEVEATKTTDKLEERPGDYIPSQELPSANADAKVDLNS